MWNVKSEDVGSKAYSTFGSRYQMQTYIKIILPDSLKCDGAMLSELNLVIALWKAAVWDGCPIMTSLVQIYRP